MKGLDIVIHASRMKNDQARKILLEHMFEQEK